MAPAVHAGLTLGVRPDEACVLPQVDVWGTDHEEGVQLDQAKVREAMERLDKRERQRREESQADDRKRK